ncbi:MAG: hypothetical protein QXE01_02035 [Sulfolobales archaeon]
MGIGKRYIKGLSELVVIMIAVAIAIPVMFLLQAWLTGQIAKMPELESVAATYNAKLINTNTILVSITVTNNGNDPISVDSILAVYTTSNGSIKPLNTTTTLSGNLPITIDPKSSKTIIINIDGASNVDSIVVAVRSLTTNAQKMIKATGI